MNFSVGSVIHIKECAKESEFIPGYYLILKFVNGCIYKMNSKVFQGGSNCCDILVQSDLMNYPELFEIIP